MAFAQTRRPPSFVSFPLLALLASPLIGACGPKKFAGKYPQISAGERHTCAVSARGDSACWGSNVDGESSPPLVPFRAVATGAYSCALNEEFLPTCWGQGPEPPATPMRQLAVGHFFSCGVKTKTREIAVEQVIASNVVCWGVVRGEVPDGDYDSVTVGRNHACGLRDNGSVMCWGDNEHGQIDSPSGTLFTDISAGDEHSCGVTKDSTLSCWGRNDRQQRDVPEGKFTKVAAGWRHTCALRSDGVALCWGDNAFGQATPPAGVFRELTAGALHTCGIGIDEGVLCWGDDRFGQTNMGM
jgi:hypothetical protein